LAAFANDIDTGGACVYLWEDQAGPAACLVLRHGRFGWFLHDAKGPRNAAVESPPMTAIIKAFAEAGVPQDSVIAAIEHICKTH
jgi:hypothetical protein